MPVSPRRRDRVKYMTKPGRHGTLTRFAITYTDPRDAGFGQDVWRTWAYDRAHAIDNFYDSEDGDEGWKILDVERVRDRS